MSTETPTAPATPALSQIRAEIEALIRRPYGCEPYGVIAQFTTLSQSLLSIADMLEQRQQWQPIETAPKDGTNILLWWPDCFDAEAIVGWWSNHYDRWNADALSLPYMPPTHWMPLPTPPIS